MYVSSPRLIYLYHVRFLTLLTGRFPHPGWSYVNGWPISRHCADKMGLHGLHFFLRSWKFDLRRGSHCECPHFRPSCCRWRWCWVSACQAIGSCIIFTDRPSVSSSPSCPSLPKYDLVFWIRLITCLVNALKTLLDITAQGPTYALRRVRRCVRDFIDRGSSYRRRLHRPCHLAVVLLQ